MASQIKSHSLIKGTVLLIKIESTTKKLQNMRKDFKKCQNAPSMIQIVHQAFENAIQWLGNAVVS